ncbi:MAG: hypothetical protein ABIM50_07405 [Novosphingobium sp.]
MTTTNRSLQCFAHGRDGDWEAICIDLDIAVQGTSFQEVQSTLNDAVRSYASLVSNEDPVTRANLLNRKAPWHVIAKLWIGILISGILDGRRGEEQASFPLPCPA